MFEKLFDLFKSKPVDVVTERDDLVAESQELGRMADEIRDRRKAIKVRIDELNALKIAQDKAKG